MTLRVEVSIPVYSGGNFEIGILSISRREPIRESETPDDEVYEYLADLLIRSAGVSTIVPIKHRRGDGAWVLISNALAALGHGENKEMRS